MSALICMNCGGRYATGINESFAGKPCHCVPELRAAKYTGSPRHQDMFNTPPRELVAQLRADLATNSAALLKAQEDIKELCGALGSLCRMRADPMSEYGTRLQEAAAKVLDKHASAEGVGK